MIDPSGVTKYDRSLEELEEFWFFSVCIPGKDSYRIARAIDCILAPASKSPFAYLGDLIQEDRFLDALQRAGVGQYGRITRCIEETVERQPCLRTSPVQDLELIHGVGPKTSRFFVLHSREDARHAVLDTHILKFLRELGHNAPASTPQGRRYALLENIFLEEAARRGMTPADLDLEIWNGYSRGPRYTGHPQIP